MPETGFCSECWNSCRVVMVDVGDDYEPNFQARSYCCEAPVTDGIKVLIAEDEE